MSFNVQAQNNLVPNPGFETFENCPRFWAEKPSDLTASNWESPTDATPDNFSECSDLSGIPVNWAGVMPAHGGVSYAGFIARRNFGLATDDKKYPTHREYLMTPLTAPMEAGREYKVSFFVSLAENCRLASDQIQAFFSKEKLNGSGRKAIFKSAAITTPVGSPITTTGSWVEVSGVYVAKGGERYMTIGNFTNNAGKATEKVLFEIRNEGKPFQFSYYYLDDVSVIAGEMSKVKPPVATTSGNTKATGGATKNPVGSATKPAGSTSKPVVTNSGSKTKLPQGHYEGDGHNHQLKTAGDNPATNIAKYDPEKHRGPIVKDFECGCAVCQALNKNALFENIEIDKIDSTTFRNGQMVSLDGIYFEPKSDQLSEDSDEELTKLVFLLKEMPETEIELVIHMDFFGNDEVNKQLSKDTAVKLYNYLRQRGVTNKIMYNGYGKKLTPPIDGRKRDRIIEMVIRKI